MLHIVDTHDVARPLLLFYTPHVAHLPLQVLPSYLEKFAALTKGTDETLCSGFQAPTRPPVKSYVNPEGSPWACRAQYHAAVNLLDDNIGEVVAAMRKRGMWGRTLMVFSSDNGGPVNVGKQASNNYPLCAPRYTTRLYALCQWSLGNSLRRRGGKFGPMEGGIRVSAFVSGGYLPPSARGTKVEGMISVADWYGTLGKLAGADPTDPKAAASGLPPIGTFLRRPPSSELQLRSDARVCGFRFVRRLAAGHW